MTTESTTSPKRKRSLLVVGTVIAIGLTAFGASSAMASTTHTKASTDAVTSVKKVPPTGGKCDGTRPPKPKDGKAPTFKKGEKPPAPPKGTHPKGVHPAGKKPLGPPPAGAKHGKQANLPPKGDHKGPGPCQVPAATTAK